MTAAGSLLPPEAVRTVGVLGAGAVGASWSALFLAQGLEVVAYDPGEGVEARARTFVSDAWPQLLALRGEGADTPPLDRLRFVTTPEEVAEAADAIQENAPERPDLKAELLGRVDAVLAPDRPILSSTGGIPPTDMQAALRHPGRLVVLHPFNPAHLVPLIEVVGGERTDPATVDWAMAFARLLGKHPIRLRREATGHMANRLQFALLREAVNCLAEGIAGPQEIDDAVRYGLGPRWALMGSLLTLHLAGGQGGMRGILDHTAQAIDGWWAALGTPRMTPEVQAKLVAAAATVAQGHGVADWVGWRDRHLVEVLRAAGAGPGTDGDGEEAKT